MLHDAVMEQRLCFLDVEQELKPPTTPYVEVVDSCDGRVRRYGGVPRMIIIFSA